MATTNIHNTGGFSLTSETLKKCFPASAEANRAKYFKHINPAFERYEIDTAEKAAAFLANIGVETGELRAVEENLNYSASGLLSVFGKYFNSETAAQYARKPEKIANRVYANRIGNGNEASGDGWKYRGRGLIQVTGRANYRKITSDMYGLPMGVDFEDEPDLLLDPEYAVESACAWWHANGCNRIAGQINGQNTFEVMRQVRKKVNGGYNGWPECWKYFNSVHSILKLL